MAIVVVSEEKQAAPNLPISPYTVPKTEEK
jgi:hypothetical protein